MWEEAYTNFVLSLDKTGPCVPLDYISGSNVEGSVRHKLSNNVTENTYEQFAGQRIVSDKFLKMWKIIWLVMLKTVERNVTNVMHIMNITNVTLWLKS